MNLARALIYLFPNTCMMKDILVRDDGEGAYIDQWNISDPQPTQEQLDQAWIEVVRKDKLNELDEACENDILSGFIASNGHHYGFSYKDQINFNEQDAILTRNPSIDTIYWKTDDIGPIPHTREEWYAVVDDVAVSKLGKIARYWQLKVYVLSLNSESEINAIHW